MRKGSNLRMMWPSTAPKPDSPLKTGSKLPIPEIIANELGFDDTLFEKLKKHRNALAQAEGVPAYVIFVGLIFVVTNTLVDLLYGLINPTVNLTAKG